MAETITRDELSDALVDLGYIFGHNSLGKTYVFRIDNPDGVADLIFRDVLRKRTPPIRYLTPEEIEAETHIIRSNN